MHLIYEFRGKDLDMEKLDKSVTLAERYCGVADVYRKAGVQFTHEIKILD